MKNKLLVTYLFLITVMITFLTVEGQETKQAYKFDKNKWNTITRNIDYTEIYRERKPKEKKKNNQATYKRKSSKELTLGNFLWFKYLVFGIIITILVIVLYIVIRSIILKQDEKIKDRSEEHTSELQSH